MVRNSSPYNLEPHKFLRFPKLALELFVCLFVFVVVVVFRVATCVNTVC